MIDQYLDDLTNIIRRDDPRLFESVEYWTQQVDNDSFATASL